MILGYEDEDGVVTRFEDDIVKWRYLKGSIRRHRRKMNPPKGTAFKEAQACIMDAILVETIKREREKDTDRRSV
jgi:hypothetical protein